MPILLYGLDHRLDEDWRDSDDEIPDCPEDFCWAGCQQKKKQIVLFTELADEFIQAPRPTSFDSIKCERSGSEGTNEKQVRV